VNIIQTPTELFEWRQEAFRRGKRVALVPTMGNLHAGHLSLIDKAKTLADDVVVSIFVNPLQFGPTEDFDKYPRTLAEDCVLCEKRGVSVIFSPSSQDIHPIITAHAEVRVPGLSDELCGKSRPGFFYGVTTVVSKLFNLVRPEIAVFGEKDYQQYKIIERMVTEMCYPLRLVCAPTVREANGLAMSSRNQYLSDKEFASQLYKALITVKQALQTTTQNFQTICEKAKQDLTQLGFTMDYLEIRRASDLAQDEEAKQLKILVAAWLKGVRLIDNLSVERA
jgi:pantoate--beta-alanine ligase